MLFENMGLTYLGPVDGHNMRQVMRLFNEAKRVEGTGDRSCPYRRRAEAMSRHGRHPDQFHGTGPFDIAKTGEEHYAEESPTYTDVFADAHGEAGQRSMTKLVGHHSSHEGRNRLAEVCIRNIRTVCLMWESQRSMQFPLQQDWHLAE